MLGVRHNGRAFGGQRRNLDPRHVRYEFAGVYVLARNLHLEGSLVIGGGPDEIRFRAEVANNAIGLVQTTHTVPIPKGAAIIIIESHWGKCYRVRGLDQPYR